LDVKVKEGNGATVRLSKFGIKDNIWAGSKYQAGIRRTGLFRRITKLPVGLT
jgi:hypothetical protein